MRPADILGAQIDLIERLDNPGFSDMIARLTAFHVGGAPVMDLESDFAKAHPELVKENKAEVARISERYQVAGGRLKGFAKTGYAYRVTADMSAMVQFAASQLDDEDTFDASLAPTGCGIVGFDKPLPVKDIRGKTMLIHWIVWGPSMDPRINGLSVFEFNDTWIEPDEVQGYFEETAGVDREAWELITRMQGRWATIGMAIHENGRRMGNKEWSATSDQVARVIEEGFEPHTGTNTMRYIHALFLLLNQTVTKVEDDEPADRPTRRRAKRMDIPQAVTVIRLRREISSLEREPGESLVQWSHRWIVRGHWRWQVCGVGRADRKRIWINPFEKGPEGAPLIVSDKVYSLER